MIIRSRKTPHQKEMHALEKKESKFFAARAEKKESFINQKFEEKVPAKLQKTLDDAFAKAFAVVFDKGTGVIERTYRKSRAEGMYYANEIEHYHKGSRRTLKAFSNQANGTGRKNLVLSGVTGIGLGALGVGIPDIPVFTAMIMKAVYEIATSYGYRYDTEEEKAFILMIIEGALSYGDHINAIDADINRYIEEGVLPEGYDRDTQISRAAGTLSKELLYMKFLQGIPIVGAVGGFYDAIYMKRITEYAALKYRRRFLHDKR